MRIRPLATGLLLIGSAAGAQTFGGYDMQLNGSGGNGTPLITGGVLRLMDDAYGSASSAFTLGTFAFTPAMAWSSAFTLRYAFTSADVNQGFSTGGDGIAFVMQGGDALGGGGGEMGYGGIPNSFAISFRSFWNDVLIGQDGVVDSQIANADPAGLLIEAGDDFFINVALAYDGANHLSIAYSTDRGYVFAPTIFDLDPTSIGSTVRFGFTAGSGNATQLAEVTDWEIRGLDYTPPTTATPEPATVSLMAMGMVGLGIGARRRRRA